MNVEYFDIALISPQSPSYMRNNRRYKRVCDNIRKNQSIDYFSTEYYKALRKWEFVVQCLLSTLSAGLTNRILRYSNVQVGVRYREIDFITKPSEDQLVFCELKLKANYHEKLRSKASGWQQLNKSLSIATGKYNNVSGLSICVDMSHVYGKETTASALSYCKFAALKEYLKIPKVDKKILWLDSKEIAFLAVEHKLLTLQEVSDIKRLYREFKDPLSIINTTDCDLTHSPFQQLHELKIAAASNKPICSHY